MWLHLVITPQVIDALSLLVVAIMVGLVAGMVGIGGGLLMAPLLMFYQIPPVVAVATCSALIVASSLVSVPAALRNKSIDLKLGLILSSAGILGALLGVMIVTYGVSKSQINAFIPLFYVLLLSCVSLFFFYEMVRDYLKPRSSDKALSVFRSSSTSPWVQDFPVSGLRYNVLYLFFGGVLLGVISAMTGIGGNIILIPVLTLLFKIPMNIVVPTAVFQVGGMVTAVLFFHAFISQEVDVLLAFFLIFGGSIGGYYGSWFSRSASNRALKAVFMVVVVLLAMRLIYINFIQPEQWLRFITI